MPCLYFLNCEILKRHTSFYLAVNLILLPMHSSVSLFSILIMSWLWPQSLCFLWSGHSFRSMCRAIAGVANQKETKSHILTVLPQRAISYTWAHMKNISASLPHPHTGPQLRGRGGNAPGHYPPLLLGGPHFWWKEGIANGLSRMNLKSD